METTEILLNAFLHYDMATSPWGQGVAYDFNRTIDLDKSFSRNPKMAKVRLTFICETRIGVGVG